MATDELACTNCFNRATKCVEQGDRRERRRLGALMIAGMSCAATAASVAEASGRVEADRQGSKGVKRVR